MLKGKFSFLGVLSIWSWGKMLMLMMVLQGRESFAKIQSTSAASEYETLDR